MLARRLVLQLVLPMVAIGQAPRLVLAGHSLTISEPMEGRRGAIWSGGSLVVPEGPLGEENAFRAYDGNGQVVFNSTFTAPGADHTYVRGFSRGPDGIVAVCGLAMNEGSANPFLATISADGVSQQIVRTGPYVPNVVSVAPDGTFWTVGRELDADLSEKTGVNLEAGVLRHFDRSGNSLGAFVPRSSISDTTTLASGSSFLVTSHDRVGWLRFTPAGQATYVEIENGSQTSTYPMPIPPGSQVFLEVNGLAMTDDGGVFVAVMFVETTPPKEKKTNTVLMLDRTKHEWVSVASPDIVHLYGAAGSELAVRMTDDSPAKVRFLSVRR